MKELSVEQLLEETRSALQLELVSDAADSVIHITTSDVNRPGLLLVGFTENFLNERIQILGETEILYLDSLDEAHRAQAIQTLFFKPLPCIIVTKGQDVYPQVVQLANEKKVPILRTPLSTTPFIHLLTAHLSQAFATQTVVHGTLVDVYGVGLLFTGKSGIGKSECALDLVERGHRLVADDVVVVTRTSPGVVVGRGDDMLRHHMEIRGVGIIDIPKMFGIRAVRRRKRVEVEVRLELWDEQSHYDRIGLDDTKTSILGVKIGFVTIPIIPGKNITVISEVVALSHLLKVFGFDSAKDFSQNLRDAIVGKTAATGMLDIHDNE
jgi:HPr kinase/phosphorylase